MEFSAAILKWYATHKRELPWRSTREPYKIWLSEIILQQTRVAQGIPYYLKFLEAFPTVHALAKAPEQEVLKVWQGLGYYSRARNLHATAQRVSREMGGEFPTTFKDLLELKGVGDYTAAAIASICFGEAVAVVDGNVYRVLSRHFGIDTPIDTGAGQKEFKSLADALIPKGDIRDYNQGIMEFGAVQCVPKNPDCGICPLKDSCSALASNVVKTLPVKQNKTKVRTRYFNYLVLMEPSSKLVFEQRKTGDIWAGLYQFPLAETTEARDLPAVQELLREKLGNPKGETEELFVFNEKPIVHKLSHQHIVTTFWGFPSQVPIEGALPLEKAEELPMPVLISNFMSTLKNAYF